MYLSRIRLDLSNRQTMKALVSPNLFHGAVEHAFSGERERKLWRIDHLNGNCYMLLLSPSQPDLTAAAQQFGVSGDSPAWETRDYTSLLARIQPNTRWRFRLVANPTRSCKASSSLSAENQRGAIHAHITTHYQCQWLMDRAEKHGFSLSPDEFTVVHNQWLRFQKGNENGRQVTLLAATYEGILTVTDVALFRQALTNGIGRGKAYGMGLLTIVQETNPHG